MDLNRKHLVSWTLFDFANSSYSAVISAVVFPVFYTSVIVGNEAGYGDMWWGRAISVSMLAVAFTSPFMGGAADYGGARKRFLFIYTSLCVLCVASFSVLRPGMVFQGFLLMAAANIGMEGGLVFYNSFLPRIAPKEYQGRVSGWGYMVGYAGSIIALLISLPLVNSGRFPETWIMVAVFFALFSLPAFLFLPRDVPAGVSFLEAGKQGMRQTLRTLRELWNKKEERKFLFAYFLYEDGVNTVIVFSSIFAAATLGFAHLELILLYLTVQVSAVAGSLFTAKPIDTRGPKQIVLFSLLLWTGVSVTAYFVETKPQFWMLAAFAGLGLGAVQAASRAFYAQFIRPGKEAQYFGVYSLAGKSSAVLGPLVFGHVSMSFGSQRPAILSVAFFFLAGLIILMFVRGGGPNLK
jgi:MFS transporter, UMF1 family